MCQLLLRTHSQLLDPTDPWDFLHLGGLSITSSVLRPPLHLCFNLIYCSRVTGSAGNSVSPAKEAVGPSLALGNPPDPWDSPSLHWTRRKQCRLHLWPQLHPLILKVVHVSGNGAYPVRELLGVLG